jgi:hypothetical protein
VKDPFALEYGKTVQIVDLKMASVLASKGSLLPTFAVGQRYVARFVRIDRMEIPL